MSKLPKAPLLEVIFEIRWDILKSGLQKYQFLPGDLYEHLKGKYPYREPLVPAEIPPTLYNNKPAVRFRTSEHGYPLIQIGPGILSVNADNELYDWDNDYFARCREAISVFEKVYSKSEADDFTPSLIYMDFFPIEITEVNALKFINDNFHIRLEEKFIPNSTSLPNRIDIGLSYTHDVGTISFAMNVGANSKGEKGILMQTQILGSPVSRTEEVSPWLEKAHLLSTEIFKGATEGKLYDSFK